MQKCICDARLDRLKNPHVTWFYERGQSSVLVVFLFNPYIFFFRAREIVHQLVYLVRGGPCFLNDLFIAVFAGWFFFFANKRRPKKPFRTRAVIIFVSFFFIFFAPSLPAPLFRLRYHSSLCLAHPIHFREGWALHRGIQLKQAARPSRTERTIVE